MKNTARFVVLLVVALVVALPAAALASSDSSVLATEEPAEEEMSEEPVFEEGQEPAEVAPPASESDEEQPWTTRFIAPTLVVLGVLTVVGFVVYYGIRVRSRFEVVD